MQRKIATDAGPLTSTKTFEEVYNEILTNEPKYGGLKPEKRFDLSTESAGRFFEKQQFLSLDSLEYGRDGDDPGLILVFNQENFDRNMESREGSSKDVNDIITCFGRLGFNISKKNILENLSKEEIFKEVDKVLKSDLSQFNSLLVFILSHGEDCNQIYSRTEVFQLEDLLMKFEKCAALKGKPKLFVVQACKGREETILSDVKKNTLLVPLSTFEKFYQDTVIVYSTIEGRYSFRHSDYGSWLIQEICRNFTAYGRRDDVLTVLSRVIKCICTNYYHSNCKSEVVKQIPVVVSSLSRKFYLNRNKDRHFVIRSCNMQVEILDYLKTIRDELKKKIPDPPE